MNLSELKFFTNQAKRNQAVCIVMLKKVFLGTWYYQSSLCCTLQLACHAGVLMISGNAVCQIVCYHYEVTAVIRSEQISLSSHLQV